MSEQQTIRQRGQTLVIVALAMTVLMLMAGLAVDVGMAYNDRRDMQNAADAAALAGAQKWCDNQEASAGDFARYVAVELNGADDAMTQVTSANYHVNVIAGTNAQTFFFRLVGISSVPVSAEAEASCGCASAAGANWPVLFDQPSWDGMGSCTSNAGLVANLIVWSADNGFVWEDGICATCDCERAELEYGLPDGFLETLQMDGTEGTDPGDRGWARLGSPSGYIPPETISDPSNCGNGMVEHWLKYGYQGVVDLGFCVPGKPGIGDAVEGAAPHVGSNASILLFNPPSIKKQDCTVTVGDYNGSACTTGAKFYEISGFGCIHVVGWTEKFTLYKIDNPNQKCVEDGAIFAQKVCSGCETTWTGSASPGAPYAGCVTAVSLVK